MAWTDCAEVVPCLVPAAPSGYAAGAVVEVVFDSSRAVAEGRLRADRKDLHVVRAGAAIDRVLVDTKTIAFRLQAAIAPGVASTEYSIRIGYPAEAAEPAQNPRQVFPFYVDGADLAALVRSGSVSAFAQPRPGFLKRPDPVIAHDPVNNWGVRDVWGLVFDGSLYHAWFADAGLQGYATSPDLYTWTRRTGTYPAFPSVNAPIAPRQVAAISPQFQLSGGDWFALTVASGPLGFSDPAPPWWIMGAMTGPTLQGPWTYLGRVIEPGPLGYWDDNAGEWVPASLDEATTSAASVGTVDGGATYLLFHGTMTGHPWRGVGLVTATDLRNPATYVKTREVVLDGLTEQVENPVWMHDPARGMYYILACHIGDKDALGEHIVSQALYWSTDPLNWDPNNKTTIVEPTHGKWDEASCGLNSHPTVRAGVLYNFFDGSDKARLENPAYGVNWGHSAGIAEARWPFLWGSGIQLAAGATIESPAAVLVGDGVLRARVRFRSSGAGVGFGVRGGGNSYILRPPAVAGDYAGNLRVSVDGAAATSTNYRRVLNHTKTIEFRRTGSTLSIIYSGWKVWEGAASSGPLTVYAEGDLVVEEARAVSAIVPATTELQQIAGDAAAGHGGAAGALTQKRPVGGAAGGQAAAGAELRQAYRDVRHLTITAGAATKEIGVAALTAASGGEETSIRLFPSGYYGPTVDLVGAGGGQAGAAGTARIGVPLVGGAGGQAGAGAAPFQARPLAGGAGGHADAGAAPSQARPLAGAAGGQAGAGAGPSQALPLVGGAGGHADAGPAGVGQAGAEAQDVSGAAGGAGGAAAVLGQALPVAAGGGGQAGAAAVLGQAQPLAGGAGGQGGGAAQQGEGRALAGEAGGQAGAAGSLEQDQALAGGAGGQAAAGAAAVVSEHLRGTAGGHADVDGAALPGGGLVALTGTAGGQAGAQLATSDPGGPPLPHVIITRASRRPTIAARRVGGVNLLTNAGFIVDTDGNGMPDGWYYYGTNTSSSAIDSVDIPFGGTNALVATFTVDVSPTPRLAPQRTAGNLPFIAAGVPIVVSAYVKTTAGKSIHIGYKGANAAGTEVYQGNATLITATGAWQRVILKHVPTGSYYLFPTFGISSAVTGDVFRLAGAQLEFGTVASPFVLKAPVERYGRPTIARTNPRPRIRIA
jgi:hypothetical protein